MSCAKSSLVGDFQCKADQEYLPAEWANYSRISGSWASDIKPLDLDSGIQNPTSLRTSFERELQTKPKQDLSQKIYTRTAQLARLPGEHTSHLFLAGICFAPCIFACINGVLVLDST